MLQIFVCNVLIFEVSQCVYPQQVFPAQSNLCGQAQQPKLAIRSGRRRPYPQILGYQGKACQEQTLQLITNIRKLGTKIFTTLAPGSIYWGQLGPLVNYTGAIFITLYFLHNLQTSPIRQIVTLQFTKKAWNEQTLIYWAHSNVAKKIRH